MNKPENKPPTTADELSVLVFAAMTTPTPTEYDGSLKQQVRTSVAQAITSTGIRSRTKLSADIEQKIQANPDKVKWISDLHLFHSNIIRLSGRAFSDVDEMNETIIRGWHETVSDSDTVLILGDISWADERRTNSILETLPGTKILITGNHDIPRNGKPANFSVQGVSDCLLLSHAGKTLLVSHVPIPEEMLPDGCVSVHGHTHSYETFDRAINVSVEWTDYRPITTTEMLSGLSCPNPRKRAVPAPRP